MDGPLPRPGARPNAHAWTQGGGVPFCGAFASSPLPLALALPFRARRPPHVEQVLRAERQRGRRYVLAVALLMGTGLAVCVCPCPARRWRPARLSSRAGTRRPPGRQARDVRVRAAAQPLRGDAQQTRSHQRVEWLFGGEAPARSRAYIAARPAGGGTAALARWRLARWESQAEVRARACLPRQP